MNTEQSRSLYIRALALLGGGIAAGVIGTTALGANAQSTGTTAASTSTSTSSSSSSGTSTSTYNRPNYGNSNETPVTGAKAATLKANALKKAPGATIDSVTTEDPFDSSGAAYEVHLTKADGSHATLLFDSKLAYLSTETSGERGGHGGGRGGAGETTVTGTRAATLKAAALAHVPGATVNEVSTDSGDAAFEVHLTKADGTQVTVKFDKNLKYVSVESGRGK